MLNACRLFPSIDRTRTLRAASQKAHRESEEFAPLPLNKGQVSGITGPGHLAKTGVMGRAGP